MYKRIITSDGSFPSGYIVTIEHVRAHRRVFPVTRKALLEWCSRYDDYSYDDGLVMVISDTLEPVYRGDV